MKHLDPKTIGKHVDGELTASEAEEVARTLEQDSEARRLHDETRRVGDAVRLSVKARTEDRPLSDLWPAIEARIASDREGIETSFSERVKVWFQSRMPHVGWPVWAAAGAAILAGVVLWVGLMSRSDVGSTTERTGKASNQIVFESIDYDGTPPTVFQIPDPDGKGSTTVIWVEADDAEEEDGGDVKEGPSTGDSI